MRNGNRSHVRSPAGRSTFIHLLRQFLDGSNRYVRDDESRIYLRANSGGWEEIWRSLESVEFFDLDAVTNYVLKLDSAVTVAKVGFYLEQHREELMVEEWHLDRLREYAPSHPMYLERGKREPGKLLARWNLVVPERVLNRAWAEVT
ncbi:MAG: hypothetical protein ACYDAA_19405 [Syntrophales bacterium]